MAAATDGNDFSNKSYNLLVYKRILIMQLNTVEISFENEAVLKQVKRGSMDEIMPLLIEVTSARSTTWCLSLRRSDSTNLNFILVADTIMVSIQDEAPLPTAKAIWSFLKDQHLDPQEIHSGGRCLSCQVQSKAMPTIISNLAKKFLGSAGQELLLQVGKF